MTASDRKVDVSGIDNHEFTGIQIVTTGGVVKSQRDEMIAIFHQFVYVPGVKTIISYTQLEAFAINIYNKSKKLQRGEQCITTLEGFFIPMNFINGLPYVPIRPFSVKEQKYFIHIVLTSDEEWDPSVIDKNITDDTAAMEAIIPNPIGYYNSDNLPINSYGIPNPVSINFHFMDIEQIRDDITDYQVLVNDVRPSRKDYEKYKDYFLRVPINVI